MQRKNDFTNPGAGGSFLSNKLDGLYRARVEDNADPKKIGRVRVRIPKIHGTPDDSTLFTALEDLPWAVPCFAGAGYEFGSVVIPEVGEYVFVAFEGGEKSRPVYLGSCYGVGAKESKPYGSIDGKGDNAWSSPVGKHEVPTEAWEDKNYPHRKLLYKTPKGSLISLDDKSENDEEIIVIRDKTGQQITFTIDPEFGKQPTIKAEGDNLDLSAEGEAVIRNKNVEIRLTKRGTHLLTVGGTTIEISGNSVTVRTGSLNISGVTTFNDFVSLLGGASIAI